MAKTNLPPLIMASQLAPTTFVTTGLPELDEVLTPTGTTTPGGFPLGRVTEVFGLEGVGKTSLTLRAIAGMQHAGKKVLFIDVENALNTARALEFGVKLETLAVSTEVTVEIVAELVAAHCSQFDAIVIDSLAAMVPRAEYEGEAGEAHMGLKARIMGQFMRRIIKPLADSHCALIFINQERMNLQPWGPKRFTPGGKAVPFATSLRIELTSLKSDKVRDGKDKQVTSQWVNATVVKSKVSKPYVTARFQLKF
jgi:recombination protein RecA